MTNLRTQNSIPIKISGFASSNKSNKRIEILIIPKLEDIHGHQENIGIELDENIILEILSQRFHHVIITLITTESDLKSLALRNPDLVFSGVKYFEFNEETIWLNDFLDAHNIPYIASPRIALNREYDKCRAKEIMEAAKIKTARFLVAKPNQYRTEKSIPIPFPLFIKPVSSGDSMGIDANSIVNDFQSFQSKVQSIYREQHCNSLVETYLSGKEYSVGILEDTLKENLTAMPIEIIAEPNKDGHRILDFDIKRNDSEKVVAVTDDIIRKKLSDLAIKSFRALGGKALGRIDIRMSNDNVPHFMEANFMPGLRKGYFFRACVLNLDMSYEQMILSIAEIGLAPKSSQIVALPQTILPTKSIAENATTNQGTATA